MRVKKGAWDENRGRNKETYVNSKNAWKIAAWRYKNPTNSNKSNCAKGLLMSRTTVTKWWNGVDLVFEKSGGTHFLFPFGLTEKAVANIFKEFLSDGY